MECIYNHWYLQISLNYGSLIVRVLHNIQIMMLTSCEILPHVESTKWCHNCHNKRRE